MQISTQLASFSINGGFINSTVPPLGNSTGAITSFMTSPASVRVNALWFCSLILSLTSAAGGIHAKDWLRTFSTDVAALPHDAARIREFRYRTLEEWNVPNIISLLPTLLEVALLLFIVGILDFLWTLNTVVAIMISVLTVFTVLPLTILPFGPLLFETCPFVSSFTRVVIQPFLNLIYLPSVTKWFVTSYWYALTDRERLQQRFADIKFYYRLHYGLSTLPVAFSNYLPSWSISGLGPIAAVLALVPLVTVPTYVFLALVWFTYRSTVIWRKHPTWERREAEVVKHNDDYLDAKLLAAADASHMDDNTVLESIRRHLSVATYSVSRDALRLILTHRSQDGIDGIRRWDGVEDKGRDTLAHMTTDVINRICAEDHGDGDLSRMLRILDAFCDALPKAPTSPPEVKDLYNRIFDCLACEVIPSKTTGDRMKETACTLLYKLETNVPTLLETKAAGMWSILNDARLKLIFSTAIQSLVTYLETLPFNPTYILALKIVFGAMERKYDPTLAPTITGLVKKFQGHSSDPNRTMEMTGISYEALGSVLSLAKSRQDLVPVDLLKELHTLSQDVELMPSASFPDPNPIQAQNPPYSQLFSEFLQNVHGVAVGRPPSPLSAPP